MAASPARNREAKEKKVKVPGVDGRVGRFVFFVVCESIYIYIYIYIPAGSLKTPVVSHRKTL